MRRGALIAVKVLAVVLVVLGVRELWLAVRGDEGRRGAPSGAIVVTTSVTPGVAAFGAPVVATADVVANARIVSPDTIRIAASFAPYELTGKPTVERDVMGDTAHLVFRYPLRCLREGCEPAGARGVARFEPGLVNYRFRDSPGTGRGVVDWPPIEVTSRVAAADVEGIRWRANETELPTVTTRVGPTALAVMLLLGGLVLGWAAVWLARRLWHVAPTPLVGYPEATRPPIERALELARADLGNGASAPDRRRALERLARELGVLGLDDLADEARSLAWSPRVSTTEEIQSLARRVGEATGRAALA